MKLDDADEDNVPSPLVSAGSNDVEEDEEGRRGRGGGAGKGKVVENGRVGSWEYGQDGEVALMGESLPGMGVGVEIGGPGLTEIQQSGWGVEPGTPDVDSSHGYWIQEQEGGPRPPHLHYDDYS